MKEEAASYTPISLSELKQALKDLLDAKGLHEFELAGIRLELKAYFFFDYLSVSTAVNEAVKPPEALASADSAKDSAVEGPEEAEGTEIGEAQELSGSLAFDPEAKSFNESLPEMLAEAARQPLHEIEKNAKQEGIETAIIDSRLSLDDAEKIILLKLSKQRGVSKNDLAVTNLRLEFIPFYSASISIDGQEASLRIDALQGLLAEGLDELPSAAGPVPEPEGMPPTGLISAAFNSLAGALKALISLIKFFFSSQKRMIILILIVVALLLFAYIRGWIK